MRCLRQRCSYVKAGFVFEGVDDGADGESFEAADRFASAFAFGLFAFEVGACGRVVAGLCSRCGRARRWVGGWRRGRVGGVGRGL